MYLAILSLVTVVAAAWTWLPRQAPLQQEDLAPVEHSLADVPEVPQRVRVLGYDRAAFGAGWRPEGGCTMREAVINTQFAVAPAADCALPHTVARDPYAGEDLVAGEVEIVPAKGTEQLVVRDNGIGMNREEVVDLGRGY